MHKTLNSKKYFTRDVQNQIKLYSIDKNNDNVRVIGSLAYKTSYPSDVDLFQIVSSENINEVKNIFTYGIKKIVNDLMSKDKQFFLEVKLGLNPLFKNIYMGHCINDVWNIDPQFFDTMEQYYKNNLIKENDIEVIREIRNKYPRNQYDYEIIHDIIRKYSVLRWNNKEINDGYKIINKNKPYSIEEAIMEISDINIEGIYINGEGYYTECSNFFVLRNGKAYINLPKIAEDYYKYQSENLRESIYELTYSKLHRNLFKSLKRIFSLSKTFKKMDLIEKIYPFLNSQIGILYLMLSQLKTITKIIKHHGVKYLKIEPIYKRLDYMRFKLQELIFINFDFEPLIELINIVLSNDTVILEDFVDCLEIIQNQILEYINDKTFEFMKSKSLYPLPDELMPENKLF